MTVAAEEGHALRDLWRDSLQSWLGEAGKADRSPGIDRPVKWPNGPDRRKRP